MKMRAKVAAGVGLVAALTPVWQNASGQGAGEYPDDVWQKVAECESGSGRTSSNVYQFTDSSWAAVASVFTPTPESASPAEQLAAAKAWARIVDPASTAGWPNCWPRGAEMLGNVRPGTNTGRSSPVDSSPPASAVAGRVGLTG